MSAADARRPAPASLNDAGGSLGPELDPLPPELVRRLAEAGVADGLTELTAAGLHTPRGLEALLDAAEELLHADPEVALRLSHLGEQAADPGRLIGVRARARYQQAQVLAERGDLERSLGLIRLARADWSEFGDELAALGTDLGQMQVLDDLGRHGAAVQVGERLLDELDRRPQPSQDRRAGRIHAYAIENLGVAYGLTGQHESALAAYAQAQQEYHALGLRVETARPLANRGVELIALGRPREALDDLAAAAEIFAAAGDRLFAAQCQGDRAHAHRLLGEVAAALRLLEPARRTLEELGARAEAARVQLALSETYLAAGLSAEARLAAEKAEATTTQAGMTHDNAMARYLMALADLASGHGELAAAELDRAADLFATVDDRQALARVQLAQAEAACLSGGTERAVAVLSQACGALERGGWLIPLTWAYLRHADLVDPVEEIAGCLELARGLSAELRLPELSYQYELRAGRLARRRGRMADAEAHFERAITVQERTSGALPDHVLLTAFRAERLAAHTELVDLLVDRGDDPGRILVLADRVRAQTLTDLQTDAVGAGPRLTSADQQLSEAFAELNAGYLALQYATGPALRTALLKRSERLEGEVSALRLRRLDERVRPPTRGIGRGAGRADHVRSPAHLSGHRIRHPRVRAAGRSGRGASAAFDPAAGAPAARPARGPVEPCRAEHRPRIGLSGSPAAQHPGQPARLVRVPGSARGGPVGSRRRTVC